LLEYWSDGIKKNKKMPMTHPGARFHHALWLDPAWWGKTNKKGNEAISTGFG
jgi:hypothetical protein